MRTHIATGLALAGVLALGACAPAAPEVNSPADLAAVAVTRSGFVKAFNAGDAASFAGLYGADPISMTNHQPSAAGIDAIVAANKAMFAQMNATLELTAEETRTMGTFGFDRGRFKMTMTPKAGGPPILDEGRYLVLLEKQADGSWKVTRDMDNSTLPMPMPPAPAAPAGAKAPTGKGR